MQCCYRIPLHTFHRLVRANYHSCLQFYLSFGFFFLIDFIPYFRVILPFLCRLLYRQPWNLISWPKSKSPQTQIPTFDIKLCWTYWYHLSILFAFSFPWSSWLFHSIFPCFFSPSLSCYRTSTFAHHGLFSSRIFPLSFCIRREGPQTSFTRNFYV